MAHFTKAAPKGKDIHVPGAHDICFLDRHTLFISQVISKESPNGGIIRCIDDVPFNYYGDKCNFYGICKFQNGLAARDGPLNRLEIISKDRVKVAEWQLPAGKHKGIDANDDGLIFICDSGGNCIRVYNPGQGLFKVILNDNTRKPQYIATTDSSSFIFTSLGPQPSITKMDLDGRVIWQHDELEYPQGIAVDRNGDVYVCDCKNNKIVMITCDGQMTFNIVDRKLLNNECPFAVAICEDMLAVQLMDKPIVKLFQLS